MFKNLLNGYKQSVNIAIQLFNKLDVQVLKSSVTQIIINSS